MTQLVDLNTAPYRAVLDNSGNIVAFIDQRGKVISANFAQYSTDGTSYSI